MNHTEHLTRYTANFIDELVHNGLTNVIISPGSRSTPLAMLCCEHESIKEWILVDERSAAYFALGMAKKLKQPVALVCTSGTAAANYLPAVVEAYHDRVPLVVLTADRPHELRGIGASQTINQMNMYGNFIKDFQEMALPEGTDAMIRYVRNRAARAVRIAKAESQGPVQVNFPFREPLVPDFYVTDLWGTRENSFNPSRLGKKQLMDMDLEVIAEELSAYNNGLIVCGPQTDENLAEAIIALSKALSIPVLADPLSNLRAGAHEKDTVITSYDSIFRIKEMRRQLRPDYIIRFGAMPISKSYMFYIQEHADCKQIVVENQDMMREPTNHPSEYMFADGTLLCEGLLSYISQKPVTSWLKEWQELEKVTTDILVHTDAEELTEGEAVRLVCEGLANDSDLFVANSMPVRDVDTFFHATDQKVRIYGNRGASGIDGVTSTALGIAAASQNRITLIIGDLSFYHDLNGLLAAKQYEIDMTVILINNNGGGIFSFLPQAKEEKHFETLFGTPLHIDFEKVVTMYEGYFYRVHKIAELQQALNKANNQRGLSVIEVCTERKENAAWHNKVWNQVERGLMRNDT